MDGYRVVVPIAKGAHVIPQIEVRVVGLQVVYEPPARRVSVVLQGTPFAVVGERYSGPWYPVNARTFDHHYNLEPTTL